MSEARSVRCLSIQEPRGEPDDVVLKYWDFVSGGVAVLLGNVS